MFKTLFLLLVPSALVNACYTKQITILSDFSNEDDINFFKSTLPWIVDNIGNVLKIRYHFKDSDGAKECVLEQMKGNTYFQVSYLSKIAQGMPTRDAVGSCKINDRKLQQCLKRKVRNFIKKANREFSKVKSETTPVILLPGKKEISGNDPEIVLKSICILFGRNQPFGCLNPKDFPTSTNQNKNPNTTIPAESTVNVETNITTETRSSIETTITEAKTAGISITEAAKTIVTDSTSVETTPTTTTTVSDKN
ncbi:hypothetical protein RR48_02399 [Papilio machaon]|uniref:Uncharacterized protein n=1 Tax=Papilio machaon TaxID=76193 RepID=A0A0N1IQ37_PAPMA|nr:hypothetical protein RR48_02399 [Papilio machaon]